jgi:hypothetical protein
VNLLSVKDEEFHTEYTVGTERKSERLLIRPNACRAYYQKLDST